MEATAKSKYACPACGAEATWNPVKGALVCGFCGTTSPATVALTGFSQSEETIVEHDLVTALRSNELLMMKLARTQFLKLNEEEKDFLDDLIIETSQALETAHTYTNILSSTLDAFASIISNNQNEVLKRLTTLTLYLSVPILLASIYGMNVPLPFQDSTNAFWIPVLICLLILGLALFNYLKRYRK